MTLSRKSFLLLLLFAVHQAVANDDEPLSSESIIPSTTTTTSSPVPPASAAATLGTLFRQARSEKYNYANRRFGDETLDSSAATGAAAARVDPYERDPAYFEARCLTCDPNKAAALATTEREAYPARGWRQKGRYEYYNEDDMEDRDRRYRDRYDGYYNDRGRAPAGYDYDRYDPYGRNELFKPSVYNDRYDPYERDRYYPARPDARPPLDRPISDRPVPDPRPMFDPRPYDSRSYERGNGYDNLDPRNPYDDRNSYDSRYYPSPPARRPGYEEYGPPRYDRDRYNGRNYGRYDSRYDRYDPYDPYERNGYGRRPQPYDDRYGAPDRYGGGRSPPPGDSRGYYGGGGGAGGGGSWSGGGADRPAYASAWNYAGGNRDNWRDVGRDRDRDRDRDRNREHDRDSAFYRPRDYWYDSTAAPGGGTSYLYDRTETTTKPNSDKATSPPQVQDNNKTSYKD